MIDTVALREKVLDLAIRGKLVPQDPNDEPASVLLERIRAQKQQMVKDGKLKPKDIKDDSIIFVGEDNLHYEKFADGTAVCIEEEIPFEIPKSWVWARLGTLAQYKKGPFGSSITKAMFVPDSPTTIKVYEQKNAINKDATLGNYFISEEKYESLKGFEIFPNDIIVSCAGTIGETYVMPETMRKGIINQALMKISLYDLGIIDFYLIYFDCQLKNVAREQGHGVALKNIPPFDVLKKNLVPIPPIQEQTRIVQFVNDLLDIVNTVDMERDELYDSISSIKSKILDLAIRGKLVPQNPDDEPASVLLERIKAEKEELIKAGKIKRDKKESVIFNGEDNSYYDDIPENWGITSLNQLTHSQLLNDGDWILSENMNPEGKIKLIQLGSVGMMRYVDKGFKYLTESTFQELNCTQIYSGYMLINRIVSDKMCSCILPSIEGTLITTVDTCWIAPKEEWYNLRYLMYTLSSPTFQSLVMLNSAGTTRKRISKNNLINLPFAFPPLDEQHRIVEAIEIAFSQLDSIAESLN